MNTKLTLSIEQQLIAKAKKYAKSKNSSLSELVSNYLKLLTKDDPCTIKKSKTPITDSLIGAFKLPKEWDREDLNWKDEIKKSKEERLSI